MTKVYGYGRHSTDKQGDTEDVQRDKVMTWYLENLPAIDWGGWHYDDDVSAKHRWSERPQGRQLHLLLMPGDWLVTATSDRMFRRNSDTFTTLEQFQERGIHLRMLDMIATANMRPADKNFIEGQLLLTKQYERDINSQREKDRVAYCKKHGIPYARATSAPIGWRVVTNPTGRAYRVNQFERTVCDQLASLQAEGLSYTQLACWCIARLRQDWRDRLVRRMTTEQIVRWALRARLAGYPLIANRDEFTRLWTAGEIQSSRIS